MGKVKLKIETRETLLHFLLQNHENHRLKKGVVTMAVQKFQISRATVKRIWSRARECMINEEPINVNPKRKANCGRKPMERMEKLATMSNIEVHRRTTLRSLGNAIGIPTTSLWRLLKNGQIKRHSNAIKPLLTYDNQLKRLEHCLSFVDDSGQFKDMFNYIHIDKKWFYISEVNQKFYLLPEETDPSRHVKSKSNMVKVMFLAAVPRLDVHKNQYFDEKLGTWPFVVKEPAQCNSKNRSKGTLVTKPIELTKNVYTEMLISNVLPAIKQKWPVGMKNIIIQHDDARPHCINFDSQCLTDECYSGGWNISFIFQPPNSPDLNILDLGFFNSIQSIQYQQSPKNIDELIEVVQKAFQDVTTTSTDNVFLSLQMAMESIMNCGGKNNYKLSHMCKDKLRLEGRLPVSIRCNVDAVSVAKGILDRENIN